MASDVPTSFVQVEDPAEESVVSKVLALDVDVSKYRILLSLGAGVTDPASTWDLEGTHEVLDHLNELAESGVEGVEAVIEDTIL